MEARGAPECIPSVDAALRDSFQKIVAAAPKKLQDLRSQCEASIQKLDGFDGGATNGCVNADDFFGVLKLACEAAGCAKVVLIALDCIQKLISFGMLTARGPDPFKEAATGQLPRTLMDTVIESICGCAEGGDDAVQTQMIPTLLTAVVSQTCEVHGNSLMLAVRTCFQIHRDSKSSTNQRTAQTSLTQILSVVTQRMELSSSHMLRNVVCGEEGGIAGELKGPERGRLATVKPSADLAAMPPGQLLSDWIGSYVTRLTDKVVLEKESAAAEMTLPPPGKFGWCVVCRGTAGHYCVETHDPICGHKCKFRNLERQALVETHFGSLKEEDSVAPVAVADGDSGVTPCPSGLLLDVTNIVEADGVGDIDGTSSPRTDDAGSESTLNPHHRDALMVFRSLCKLSMKDLPPGTPDPRIVRSKRLSLELVLSMLQNCGPVFRSSERFISVLKQLLCQSLIKNSVSSIPKIFSLSLQIFVMLITSFKDHLKNEIGVFIEQIFLRILQSGNSTYQHKHRVLQVFNKLCTDAATALELFLNFDCDVDEKNIFERMIDCLSKISQGKYTSSEHANLIQPQQEQELKMLALNTLVKLMGSIVDWARRMTEDSQALGDDGEAKGATAKDADSDAEEEEKSEATFATSTSISGSAAASGSSGVTKMVEQKQRKLDLASGVNKFNIKPKRGIEYLKAHGFIGDEPVNLAEFFRNHDLGLDKTEVGNYMGEDKPFNKAVLQCLVDGHDFKDQDIDAALRAFLSNFRLPGEAQKIDRMMEKFADKFCADNPSLFENADCAFVLSFSLIMLNTDLHNPGIKQENKMTKPGFVRNNRGINNGKSLDQQYLEKLFDNILTNPFSLKEDEDTKTKLESSSAQGATQKFELFVRETENIVQRTQELMRQRMSRQKSSTYVAAQSVDHARPLFEVACWPMLATLAVLLETQDGQSSVELCIEGFKHCIRIAARFDMDTERDAFVSSLAKFTYLTTLKEMKQKNIECIKALLSIGLSEGNNLGPSWQFVLHCISQLERLQLLQIKVRQDFQFFQSDEAAAGASPDTASRLGSSSVNAAGTQAVKVRRYGTGVSALIAVGSDDREVELMNSQSVVAQIDVAQIDLLFNRSVSLSAEAIVHFVAQLARVSREELALHDQPRIFSLQKLVEVADFNMGRMRVVWARVWRVLSAHFVEVAGHPNMRICMYAIDSLRQLAMKFLEKEDLSNSQLQAEFLKPFETVMISTPGVSREVKELIVSIVSNITQARMQNIKSGWKIVFHILHAAAQEHGGEIGAAQVAFAVIEQVVEHNYCIFVENFSDGVKVLLAFGQCKSSLTTSLQAITYLLKSAEYLADESKPDPPPPPMPPKVVGVLVGDVPCEDKVAAPAGTTIADDAPAGPLLAAAHWFPILRGLSALISDPRREVRTAALNGVFDCLRDHGRSAFDRDTWQMVFRGVIFPLFDDIHHQLQQHDQRNREGAPTAGESNGSGPGASPGTAASWAAQMGPPTCLAALTALVRLFDAHHEALSFLLNDVLKLLTNCIQHETEAVARIGVEGFKQLLLHTGSNLEPKAWQAVARTVFQLFNDSMPTQLICHEIENSSSLQLPFHRDDVVIQCVVQLLLIDMLQEMITQHYSHIPPAAIMVLLDALQRSFEFAHKFNQQIPLRQALKRLGFMREMKQLPGLLKQEREALSCSLKILFQVQGDARMKESDYAQKAMERLLVICDAVLRNYVGKEQRLQEQADAPAIEVVGESAKEREAASVEMEREVMGLVPIICEVVKGIKDLEQEQFRRYATKFFPLLCELIVVNSREVRLMVRDILVDQVAPLVGAPCGASDSAVLASLAVNAPSFSPPARDVDAIDGVPSDACQS